jgi:hypothetical protein
MQAGAQPLPISGYPGVLVYPDAQDSKRFYAIAARPRVARDESGAPLINLILFGETSGGRITLSGGQFSATFDLAVTPAERAAIERQLQGSVMYPDWLDAAVTVDLGEGVSASGTPSLAGSNECVVAATLSASQAAALRDEWSRGLSRARVRYDVTLRTSDQTRNTAASSKTFSSGTSTQSMFSQFDFRTTQASQQQMTLESGIADGDLDLSDRVHMINL